MPVIVPTKWSSTDKGPAASVDSTGYIASSNHYSSSIKSVHSASSGKYYVEAVAVSSTHLVMIGCGGASVSVSGGQAYPGGDSAGNSVGVYGGSGSFYRYGTVTALFGRALTASDVVGLALDLDAKTMTAYLNGVVGGTMTGLPTEPIHIMFGSGGSASCSVEVNFGQKPFAHDVPFGYFAGFGELLAFNKVAGIVLDDAGVGAERKIYVHQRSTGKLVGAAMSSSSGTFEVTVPILDEVYVVAVDDDAGVAYNALIFDRVLPIPE